ncbi:DUF3307 domain-containing protein [Rhizobium sp. Root1220]|uniref:DUF3307 domain-containing protein n=1 Tax=Rhizobium sp. Root1220 TaxID=1736432 RepID=UPI0006F96BBB|nr:DUF3307 domain-containing protein [Rhizobium sp. Root1220]KQV83256.1 hypothetical protein ASC90_21935 [Rhizobium sp. Root1220]
MLIETILMLALMLLGAHWLCDYPLQGQFLSDAKAKGPLRFYHLVAHAGIQGAAVALVTANVWLGLVEWAAHTVIDEAKVRGKTTFAQDQALHIACKVLWLIIIFAFLSGCQSYQPPGEGVWRAPQLCRECGAPGL